MEAVVKVRDGDESCLGAIQRYTWKSKLPYRLSFEMEVVRIEPPSLLEGVARGELDGRGLWQLTSEANNQTIARYDWQVETTKWWMNVLSPVARPVFKWNHDVVMNWGAQSLAKRLGVEVKSTE